MRVGYGTYLAFTFGFGNFILILHGLTDWFKDYPLHWFAIAMLVVIIPAAVLIGHRHNRTQQKTETRNLTHLNPYIDLQVPNSKEVFYETYGLTFLDLMISTTKDDELRKEIVELRAALYRYMEGETSTEAMAREWSGPRPGRGGEGPAAGAAAGVAATADAGSGAAGDGGGGGARAGSGAAPPPPDVP